MQVAMAGKILLSKWEIPVKVTRHAEMHVLLVASQSQVALH